MADHSLASFGWLYYTPGNPEFPVLPDGIPVPHFIDIGRVAELKTGPPSENLEKKSVQGFRFTDWYFDGVWKSPDPVEFGTITQPIQREVVLHNTYRDPVTFTAADLSAVPGLTLISPTPPATIQPFGSITLLLEAGTDGDPNFDDLITFTVNGIELAIRVTGRRVVILNSRPQRPIRERISWLSDNMISVSGKEQVFALRQAPRSQVTIEQRLTDDLARARLLYQMTAVGYLRAGVQAWWQAREIDQAIQTTDTVIQVSTENMELAVGDLVSIVSPDYNTVTEIEVGSFTVSSITTTQEVGTAFGLGSSLMPLRFGFPSSTIDQATFAVAAQDVRVTVDLIEYAAIPALDLAYFDTHPVDGRPIITHPLYFRGPSRRDNILNDITRLDSRAGDIATEQRELLGRPNQPVLVYCESLADQHAWRRFLHFVRGSWGVFYIPTGTNDIPLKDPLLLGQNTFTTEPLGLASLLNAQAPFRDVEVFIDGQRYFRRITNITETPTEETVTLSDQIPGSGTVDPADVRISWLHLARIANDTATFQHLRRGEAELRFQIRGVIE